MYHAHVVWERELTAGQPVPFLAILIFVRYPTGIIIALSLRKADGKWTQNNICCVKQGKTGKEVKKE